MTIDPVRACVTGLVLAGGRGARMGGVDKGLQPLGDQPLAWHAVQKLRRQVATVALSANRHLADYGAWGVPVWPDTLPDFPGPLAGFLAGLQRADSPWLVTVPCDSPGFPDDLVERLGAASADAGTDMAIACTRGTGGALQRHPVFCLMRTSLRGNLADFVAAGGRKVGQWQAQHRSAVAVFAEAENFFNANTLAELADLNLASCSAQASTLPPRRP